MPVSHRITVLSVAARRRRAGPPRCAPTSSFCLLNSDSWIPASGYLSSYGKGMWSMSPDGSGRLVSTDPATRSEERRSLSSATVRGSARSRIGCSRWKTAFSSPVRSHPPLPW